MGFIQFIKSKWNKWYYHDIDDEAYEYDYDYDDNFEYDSDGFDEKKLNWKEEQEKKDDEKDAAFFSDADQRTVYILESLGQITEAGEKVQQFKAEYDAVTELLVDMEEIENLPKEIRLDIMEQARKIVHLEKERRLLYNETGKISEAVWNKLEKKEDEIPGGIHKMREAEKYRKLVKFDLKKLDGERAACNFRRRELITTIANCRGVAIILSVAMILCIVMLLVLQFEYQMDVRIGYIIAGLVSAITLTVLYVRYLESVSEQKKTVKTINKLITLHNTVKIRYINNTNLLAYLYQKYNVKSADQLETEWNLYMEETSARHKDEHLKEDLEFYYEKLIKILHQYRIKDPEIWTHQAKALLDPREMVEVRHSLIARRQKLREQIEYNEQIANNAKNKIKTLEKKYPKYSSEIAAITSRYNVSMDML